MFKTASEKLAKIEGIIIGYLLLVMTLFALVQVITRYVFFYSIEWLEEVTRYLMIWMTFIGTGMAVHKKMNIGIDVLPTLFSNKKILQFLNVLIEVIILLFACLYFYFSLILVSKNIASHQLTPALRIPVATMYLSVSLGSALMIIHSLANIVGLFQNERKDAA